MTSVIVDTKKGDLAVSFPPSRAAGGDRRSYVLISHGTGNLSSAALDETDVEVLKKTVTANYSNYIKTEQNIGISNSDYGRVTLYESVSCGGPAHSALVSGGGNQDHSAYNTFQIYRR